MFNIVEKSVGISDITPGMFIKFSYTKSDGTSGTYSVGVVDPYVTSDRARSPQLHGYNLEGVSDEDVVDFLFKLNYPITIDVDNDEIRLPEISSADAYDLLQTMAVIDRPYRIFTLDNIGSVSRVTIDLPREVSALVPTSVDVSSNAEKSKLVELLENENYFGIVKLVE